MVWAWARVGSVWESDGGLKKGRDREREKESEREGSGDRER